MKARASMSSSREGLCMRLWMTESTRLSKVSQHSAYLLHPVSLELMLHDLLDVTQFS